MAANRELLERAAARWGVELTYTDTWGRQHTASDETLDAVLGALGVPTDTPKGVEKALEQRDAVDWSRPFGFTQVVFEDTPSLTLRVPADAAGGSIKIEIQWEDDALQHHPYWLPELPALEETTVAGRRYVAKRVPLPHPLRTGYHHLRAYWVREPELECFAGVPFIVCPRRARTIDERVAGVAVAIYGLRSARNWGCGDFTDLLGLIDAFAPAGAAFIALNPLHAIPNRLPYNASPYLPECSLYRNYLYLDIERVPGHEPGDVPRDAIEALRAAPFVEYERVAAAKLAALRAAFQRFRTSLEFEEYAAREGPHLDDYAIYCALWQHIHAAHPDVWMWTDWPEEYRDPRSDAVAAFALRCQRDVLFWKFLQWQVDRQLSAAQTHALARGMSIGLYHDLALATDRFGADLWANRPFYATGARVGAPPDELAPSGQDWGFPPPNRDEHRARGYQLFAQSIRDNARHGGALRIDHVMRFFRLFWIPEHLSAAQGAYVRDHVEDLLGILALESHRGNFIVIGEDLGTVDPGVRHRLGEAGILGYRLLWFEKHGDGRWKAPHEYPARAAVSTTTHDLPTVAGFPLGRDIEARLAAGLVDEAEHQRQWEARHRDIHALQESLAAAGFPGDPLQFVLSTPCTLAIVNQEDLTGEMEQANLPATTWQHPNWRRKMLVAVEDLAPLAADLRRRLEASGRLPAAAGESATS